MLIDFLLINIYKKFIFSYKEIFIMDKEVSYTIKFSWTIISIFYVYNSFTTRTNNM